MTGWWIPSKPLFLENKYSMSKKIVFNQEARKALQKGVDTVADAVSTTMGPSGRAVVIERGTTIFTLDGVTVAKAVESLKDEIENHGASLVKRVAEKTNEEAGDGTTTATLLTQALLKEGIRGLDSGLDPNKIKLAFEEGSKIVIDNLQADSRPIDSKKDMAAIATISSRDPQIGKVIADLYSEIGKEGIITTEEVKTVGLDSERVEGMQIDNGFMTPYLMTDLERQRAVVDNPLILVTSQVISTNEDIINILQEVSRTDSKSIVIIAEDVTGEALQTLVLNKMQRILNVAVIKAPGYGDNKEDHMLDIVAVTGGKFVSEKTSLRVDEATVEDLGSADKVICYRDRTIIVGGKGKKVEIDNRIKLVKKELEDAESHYRKTNLQKRLARLQGGVAVIKVGAATQEESKEKQYRIEDAVNATRSAIEEGVVQGGGMALWEAAKALDVFKNKNNVDLDYRFGIDALRRAICRPAKQILDNAGQNSDVILARLEQVNDEGKEKWGFDHSTKRIKHIPNVIDPLKVERIALEQAVSVVGLFLITNAVVVNETEKDEKQPKFVD